MWKEEYDQLAYYTLSLHDEAFIQQYIVDAYTAQTATEHSKPISVVFALVGLYLFIEKKYNGKQVQRFHVLMSNAKIDWPFLSLPQNRGNITVKTVLRKPIEERNSMIEAWCKAVWEAFRENHSTIESLANYYLGQKNCLVKR
jgi:hypothetical protein